MAKRMDLRNLASLLGLFSDGTRLNILKVLKGGPKNVTALCTALGLKQPTVSHHLSLLRMANLVTGTRTGKSVVYTTNVADMKELAAAFAVLMPRK